MGVARSARYFATTMMSKACVFTENLRKLFKMWEKTKASFCMLQSPCSAAHLELFRSRRCGIGGRTAWARPGCPGRGVGGWVRGNLSWRAPRAGHRRCLSQGPHPGRCVWWPPVGFSPLKLSNLFLYSFIFLASATSRGSEFHNSVTRRGKTASLCLLQ